MVCFQTKIPNLGIFWRAVERKMLLNFMTVWNILRPFCFNLWPFGIVCGHLVFFPFWYVWTKKNLATLF
jgi:hypothetical protein